MKKSWSTLEAGARGKPTRAQVRDPPCVQRNGRQEQMLSDGLEYCWRHGVRLNAQIASKETHICDASSVRSMGSKSKSEVKLVNQVIFQAIQFLHGHLMYLSQAVSHIKVGEFLTAIIPRPSTSSAPSQTFLHATPSSRLPSPPISYQDRSIEL